MKPRIVVSKCLGFEECRYNGQSIPNDFTQALDSFVEFIKVCPEVEIGLGVPRHPIRIVISNGSETLFQPATGKDHTAAMQEFAKDFLGSVGDVDGFILKYSSPSCGIGNVKVYPPGERVAPLRKRAGFFGDAVLKRFDVPVEDEGRLTNYDIRDRFLVSVFALSRFRKVSTARDLSGFQADNKYLLLALDQEKSRELGRLASGGRIAQYRRLLSDVLKKGFTRASYSNALLKAYHGGNTQAAEAEFFESSVQRYKDNRLPLSAVLGMLQLIAMRTGNEYLLKQSIFAPYPEELVSMRDSGKVCK